MDKVKEAFEALDRAINGYVLRFDTYRAVDNRQGKRARGIQRWRVDKAIRELMLAVLDEAEAAYANNCEGANEGDDVAMAIEVLRTRIKDEAS